MVNSLRFFVRCGSSLRFFVLNSLRFFVRCGSRWRAGTQLGLTELRGWTTCTMIVPPWNHDLTSQTSFRFRWLHSQSSHILEKARNQNWQYLSVIYNDKGYASKALNGLCPTRTDNFCWITSLPILTQGILILFRDQSALHGAWPHWFAQVLCIRGWLSCRPETANQIRIYVFICKLDPVSKYDLIKFTRF